MVNAKCATEPYLSLGEIFCFGESPVTFAKTLAPALLFCGFVPTKKRLYL